MSTAHERQAVARWLQSEEVLPNFLWRIIVDEKEKAMRTAISREAGEYEKGIVEGLAIAAVVIGDLMTIESSDTDAETPQGDTDAETLKE